MKAVLDSAAFMNAEGFPFSKRSHYFLPSPCEAEIKGMEPRMRLENALHHFPLVIRDPCPATLQQVRRWASEIGDSPLSEADEHVIGLAWEFQERGEKVMVYTDDYSLQNLLKWKKIPFQGILQKGIRRPRRFSKH
ncbi:MAG: hypothetical protein U1C71_04400 [archaeon]|nr:hypothetical protein [archaeon]